MLHRDVGAFVMAVGRRWVVLTTGSAIVALIGAWEHYTGRSLSWALFLSILVAAGGVAAFQAWREAEAAADGAQQELRALREPRLAVVYDEKSDNCCRPGPGLGRIGVANLHPKSVRDALVYIDIPKIGLRDRVLAWSGESPSKGISVHQGPSSRHPHTEAFAIAGDQAGFFWIVTAYERHKVEAGTYVADVCVKGEDVTAVTARVEIIFALPKSLSVRLL